MTLKDRSIAVLAYPGYQELEFWYPLLRAREEGATVSVITPSGQGVESFLGYPVVGDVAAAGIDAAALDAVVLPGVVGGRPAADEGQAAIVRAAHAAGRPVYAVSSGAELLAELVDSADQSRIFPDADALPELVRRLRSDLAN